MLVSFHKAPGVLAALTAAVLFGVSTVNLSLALFITHADLPAITILELILQSPRFLALS